MINPASSGNQTIKSEYITFHPFNYEDIFTLHFQLSEL